MSDTPMPATNLVLVARPAAARKAVAAWQSVLPEDDIPAIHMSENPWKDDLVCTFHADRADYIEALAEIIDETLPADEPRLVSTF